MRSRPCSYCGKFFVQPQDYDAPYCSQWCANNEQAELAAMQQRSPKPERIRKEPKA